MSNGGEVCLATCYGCGSFEYDGVGTSTDRRARKIGELQDVGEMSFSTSSSGPMAGVSLEDGNSEIVCTLMSGEMLAGKPNSGKEVNCRPVRELEGYQCLTGGRRTSGMP